MGLLQKQGILEKSAKKWGVEWELGIIFKKWSEEYRKERDARFFKGQYNYINPNYLVHSDFTGTEINGKYLEIAHIQRCILLFHRPYDQISKYFKHRDVVTTILTHTTEMTLNEETIDAKRASVLCFLKSRWVKINNITGPPIVFQGEVYIYTHTYFKVF